MMLANAREDADIGAIDEVSPSEDEHLAMSIVHGEGKC